MQSFEYANPRRFRRPWVCWPRAGDRRDVLAGGTDLLSLMKDTSAHAQARGEHQEHQRAGRHPKAGGGLRIGALVTMDELAKNAEVRAGYKSLADAAGGFPARRSATWERWAATSASGRAAGITARASACSP